MQQIQFLQTTPQQLQSKINAGVKIILKDFLKNINYKKCKRQLLKREKEKLAKAILLIFRITILLIHFIEPALIQNNQSIIISLLSQVIMILIKINKK
ncbi:hypothetical protein ACFX5F_08730 [Flavobacterium sp. ZS1P70]|uniref:Transmembrane protein n=1 Tax=Flavobacterium zhoui TaxID=3230414 RepID=A0ABW6I682_9FLAO